MLRPHLAVCGVERCGPMAWEGVVIAAGRAGDGQALYS